MRMKNMKTISSQKMARIRTLLDNLESECNSLDRPVISYLLEMVRIEIVEEQFDDLFDDNGRDSPN